MHPSKGWPINQKTDRISTLAWNGTQNKARLMCLGGDVFSYKRFHILSKICLFADDAPFLHCWMKGLHEGRHDIGSKPNQMEMKGNLVSEAFGWL